MDIGARLKQERERLGYSQVVFAELAESGKHALINWEKGAAFPNAAALAAWAKVGLDVQFVVTGERNAAIPALDTSEKVLLDSYRRASAPAKANLIQTAALLAAGIKGTAPAGGQRAASSIKVSSKHGHAAGRDVNISEGSEDGKGHQPKGARSRS